MTEYVCEKKSIFLDMLIRQIQVSQHMEAQVS